MELNLNLPNLSAETIKQVSALLAGAQGEVRKDITTGTGLVAYNLEPLARLLQPINTPLRNRTPRIKNTRGGTAVNWKSIANLDVARTDPFETEGNKAATISYSVTPKSASMATIAKGDSVSFEADLAGRTFEDVKARAILRLLKNVMIIEEQALLGGRNTAMGAVTAPTCTAVDGGGTIADAAHYYVIVRAITNLGRGKKSTSTDVTGLAALGSDGALTAHTAWVEGATAYDWYIGTDNATFIKAARTTINSVSITSYDATGAAAVPADNTTDALGFDGLVAQLTAANGAYVKTLATGTDGLGTDVTLDDLYTMFQSMWDNAQASPDVIMLNSQQRMRLTALWLAANGGPTQFVAAGNAGSDPNAITGGYVLNAIVNPVDGKIVKLFTQPWLMPGTIISMTDAMPFPASDIDNPMEVEFQADYQQIDYAQVARKWEFEVFIREALKIFFPQGFGVIRNCSTKVSA